MARHTYRIHLHTSNSPSPDVVTNTDHNARSAAKKILQDIGWANSSGELVRLENGRHITVAAFNKAEDL